MLGYLLARSGVDVTVLEKHGDFFRDFRGDTVHPSTLQVLYELGLLDDFLKIPHQKVYSASAMVGDFEVKGPDFRHVPARCKFVALMPQWDFLNFLAVQAKKFPSFTLRMQHEVVGLTETDGRVTGVIARNGAGEREHIEADLVVGCDGRRAVTRHSGRLDLLEFGVPFDVLWFRISRKEGDPDQVLGNVNYGKGLILINRNTYFQAGMIVSKGSYEEIKQRGLQEFRRSIAQVVPFLAERVEELQDWEQVKLLTVQLNRLRRWYRPGLLCIGDAAHAMSPVGGVGINLAIQDAVATANLLSVPLQLGQVPVEMLARVQARRLFPTRATQRVQGYIHRGMARVFESDAPIQVSPVLRASVHIPGIHRALGYAVGMGVRPEHVEETQPRCERKRLARAAAIGVAVGLAVVIARWRR
jgi:2-polyprenyl-6-methoxyphenol hydroxylase-like FAD-dependent oxidoreductase